jgi:hypothetical protein
MRPASITAAFKCWRVESGEYTPDESMGPHWGVFWEPLQVDLPATARPSCYYNQHIVFCDKSGNKLLKDYVQHYDFIGAHPNLLFLRGMWREVVNGRVEYRNGHWYMRWGVATNTKWAEALNRGCGDE